MSRERGKYDGAPLSSKRVKNIPYSFSWSKYLVPSLLLILAAPTLLLLTRIDALDQKIMEMSSALPKNTQFGDTWFKIGEVDNAGNFVKSNVHQVKRIDNSLVGDTNTIALKSPLRVSTKFAMVLRSTPEIAVDNRIPAPQSASAIYDVVELTIKEGWVWAKIAQPDG